MRQRQLEDFLPVYCPNFDPTASTADELYFNFTGSSYDRKGVMPSKILMPTSKYFPTILVWVKAESVQIALDIFADSVILCTQYQEPGVYNRVILFIFYILQILTGWYYFILSFRNHKSTFYQTVSIRQGKHIYWLALQ